MRLQAMMEHVHNGTWTIETMIEKMCHNPAILFSLEGRGFIREGYYADIVLLEPNRPWKVSKDNILYKCGWSPFEGTVMKSKVTHTFVNGHLAYKDGQFDESQLGKRLLFNRN
jgi:dihydroorotase